MRFNVARGGSADLADMDRLAHRVFDLAGWHTELYIDARTIDDHLSHRIAGLPAVSFDHLGMHQDGLPDLLRLVEQGVKVKATGFGRIDLDPATVIGTDHERRPHRTHDRHRSAFDSRSTPVPGRGLRIHRAGARPRARGRRVLEQRGRVLPRIVTRSVPQARSRTSPTVASANGAAIAMSGPIERCPGPCSGEATARLNFT